MIEFWQALVYSSKGKQMEITDELRERSEKFVKAGEELLRWMESYMEESGISKEGIEWRLGDLKGFIVTMREELDEYDKSLCKEELDESISEKMGDNK